MAAAVGVLVLLGLGVWLLMQTPTAPNVPSTIDPGDQSTWPTGDGVWDCCQAIALAEGYNVAGSRPQRNHNPGNISDGADQFGSDGGLTTFPDDQTGWTWLYDKVKNIIAGGSSKYLSTFTIAQIAQVWTGGDKPSDWAHIVANNLGVDPNSTFGDYVG